MNSYDALEQLANDRIRQRLAEADHERLLSEARRGQVVEKRSWWAGALIARLWRMKFRRAQPIALLAPGGPCYE